MRHSMVFVWLVAAGALLLVGAGREGASSSFSKAGGFSRMGGAGRSAASAISSHRVSLPSVSSSSSSSSSSSWAPSRSSVSTPRASSSSGWSKDSYRAPSRSSVATPRVSPSSSNWSKESYQAPSRAVNIRRPTVATPRVDVPRRSALPATTTKDVPRVPSSQSAAGTPVQPMRGGRDANDGRHDGGRDQDGRHSGRGSHDEGWHDHHGHRHDGPPPTWHDHGGRRYAHYHDGRWNWYGFYYGPSFYWTRYHHGYWWWWDTSFMRWVFWWNGYWWWNAPTGVVHVYTNNTYYPYEPAQTVVVNEPQAQAPVEAANVSVVSPDGSRMVQVSGQNAYAALYARGAKGFEYVKVLGQGVDTVKFSGGTDNKPLMIMLEFADNSFALFDANGGSLDAMVVSGATAIEAPMEVPSTLPPLPDTAPGQ